MTLEEFRKKLDEDEAFRAEVEAKAKALKELNPDKSDNEREKMLFAECGVEMPAGTDINDDDMDAVAGGHLFQGPDAPDGHEIGCFFSFSWYVDEGEAAYMTNICPRCNNQLGGTYNRKRKQCPVCYFSVFKYDDGDYAWTH